MWACLRLHLIGADHLLHPHISAWGLDHATAHGLVQDELDASPGAGAAALAAQWRRGVTDDTISARAPDGMAVWALVEHTGDDPMPEVEAWVDGFAATMRSTGLDVQVAQRR